MNHLVNWVEIPATDIKRAMKFYSTILGGISFQELEIGSTKYALFPSTDQFNTGALAQGEWYKPSADGALIYLDGGDDMNVILAKVPKAGGQVVMEKTLLAKETGYIGMFIDSEGNRLALQHAAK